MSKKRRDLKLIRQGDLVFYTGHISIVYSDRWGESDLKKGGIKKGAIQTVKEFDYDIIHAYGEKSYLYKNENNKIESRFSRKVTITGNYIGSKVNGFGRIKLWD